MWGEANLDNPFGTVVTCWLSLGPSSLFLNSLLLLLTHIGYTTTVTGIILLINLLTLTQAAVTNTAIASSLEKVLQRSACDNCRLLPTGVRSVALTHADIVYMYSGNSR